MTRYHFRKRLGAATAPEWFLAWHVAAEDYLAVPKVAQQYRP